MSENKVLNHWGIWVDSEDPITGVLSNNSAVQFIADELYNGIDLDYESHLNDPEHILNGDDCYCQDMWDCGDSTWLIGQWLKDSEGLYYPDPEGEYAAIVGEIYTQVVFSNNLKRCALCSPCYPGQGDLDSEGEFLTYDLPKDAYDY